MGLPNKQRRPSKRRIEDRYASPDELSASNQSIEIPSGIDEKEEEEEPMTTSVETIKEDIDEEESQEIKLQEAEEPSTTQTMSSTTKKKKNVSITAGATEQNNNNNIYHEEVELTASPLDYSGRSRRQKQVRLSSKRLLLMLAFLLVFPMFPLALSAALGGFLAAVEGASFLDGFLYVASNLLNFATPLTDFNPANIVGVIIDVYVSVVGLLTFGIVLNVVNIFQIPLYVDQQIERVVGGKFLVPIIALCLVIPIYVSVVAVAFGALLGWVEGWAVKDGILYVFSNLLGLGTPLTEVTPESVLGDILDILISSVALGAAAVVVDYVTVLNPARYVRKRLKDRLDAFQAFGEDEPGVASRHFLAYENEYEEQNSIERDEVQRQERARQRRQEGQQVEI